MTVKELVQVLRQFKPGLQVEMLGDCINVVDDDGDLVATIDEEGEMGYP